MSVYATRTVVRFMEDTVVDGSYEAHYEDIDVMEFDTVPELAAAIRRDGCEFAATGMATAARHPDGSQIIDYGLGEREEITWEIPPGWMGYAPSIVGMLFLVALVDRRPVSFERNRVREALPHWHFLREVATSRV